MARLLAIGDIHGCSKALDLLLDQVAPTPEDLIVTLGDYVDRGPDSAGVIDRLVELRKTHQLIALRGNHEIMLLDTRDGGRWRHTWPRHGGEATLKSYGADPDDAEAFNKFPDAHMRFLDGLQSYYETESYIFVHAFADPETPMVEQTDPNLYWRKFINPMPHQSGKTWVCGHSPQRNGLPLVADGAICIDTYACGEGGWLTCLDVTESWCWQANQAGETREFALS